MWLRRAFYVAQFAAVLVLPLWIVVARAIAPTGLGAQDVLVFLSWPLLGFALLVVAGLNQARKAVRRTRALEWTDAAVAVVWWATAITYGVFISQSAALGTGLTGGLLLVVSIAAIGIAVWQLVTAARRAVQTVLADIDRRAMGPGQTVNAGQYEATPLTRGDGPVIRIDGTDAT